MSRKDFGSAIRQMNRVVFALMLRDIKSRFFGNGLGYLVAAAWPLAHILVILTVFNVMGRTTPYGEAPSLFFATGLAPVLSALYISRFIMTSVIQNSVLLNFPIVHMFDIILARGLLEILGGILMTIVLILVLYFSGVNIVPVDTISAIYGFAAALYLGFGMGVLNAVLSIKLRWWPLFYVLIYLTAYLTSGILFDVSALPANLRDIVIFNPALHTVEMVRGAYYMHYGKEVLDVKYLLGFSTAALFLGLSIERIFRRYLQSR